MPKIHPNSASDAVAPYVVPTSTGGGDEARVFTVWRKSLLFNGNGFTVFDARGNLMFRVENYSSWRRSTDVLLMDAVGKPLLTIRRKWKLTLEDNWLIYEGEEDTNPKFQMKKRQHVYRSKKVMAHVVPCSGGDTKWSYEIEGSYVDRCCSLHDEQRRQLAEIKKKDSVGDDVFRLVVESELDAAAAMAVVIVLEQMFGSRKRR